MSRLPPAAVTAGHETARAAAMEPLLFMATLPARRQDWRLGIALMLVSGGLFLALVPFAQLRLPAVPGFIGVYQSALVVVQLLTTVLLLAKFSVLRMRALLFLAGAFLFSALMATAHALSFPGLFSPTGLLGATPQTTAWLYMFWHSGFPLLVIAYALTRRPDAAPDKRPAGGPIALTVFAVGVAVAALVGLASVGGWLLPPIMVGNTQNIPVMKPVVSSVCLFSAVALGVLWRRRPHSALDVWLMVECANWVFEVALAAVFNAARFDLGFYFGRLYGLTAALFILGVLLYESTRFYGRLLVSHQRDIERNAELQGLYAKAQELDQLKTRFFANMSHEIRTPMNAIVGMTHLLRNGNPTPAQADRLDKIALASQHLLAISNDFLDFSKIESGAISLERAVFPIVAVVDYTRALMDDATRAKGLEMRVDHGDCPPWLVGDQTRLRQALLNLASNAVKFTERGHVELRCRKLHPEHHGASGLTIRFEVRDTGIGIAPEAIPGLFEAFKQVDASTTRRFGGTGLGLSITRRLAELMGGTAGADSIPGQGSCFWFTAELGVGVPPEVPQPADAGQALRERHAGARILLAEDNPINQEVTAGLLQDAGMTVEVANDGREAFELAANRSFDLILMDMQMPVMDGIESTRRIRGLAPLHAVSIIALTANADGEDRHRCEAAGMNAFLTKPVDPVQLFATVLACLDKRAEARPTPPAITATPRPQPTSGAPSSR